MLLKQIKNNATVIALAVALSIIGYLIMNPNVEYKPIEYEEDLSKRDTTVTDSVSRDTIPVYDTTYVEFEIPTPEKQDSLNEYTTNYSDQFINATVTSRVDGVLVFQDFNYIRQVKHIETYRLRQRDISHYLKPTRVYPENKDVNYSSFWIGVTNESFEELSITPNIMYIYNNKAYTVGYNLNKNSITKFDVSHLRFGVKIRF